MDDNSKSHVSTIYVHTWLNFMLLGIPLGFSNQRRYTVLTFTVQRIRHTIHIYPMCALCYYCTEWIRKMEEYLLRKKECSI